MYGSASLCRVSGLLAVVMTAVLAAAAPARADAGFPFDTELLLDADPMRGSKRVPILTVGPKGDTLIELWCNSVQSQFVVVDDTLTILTTGQKSERQCDPERMRADEELLAALLEVTGWRWENDLLVLRGGRPGRFRRSTH